MDYFYRYQSPLGQITLASDGELLTGLWFEGQKYFGSTLGIKRTERELSVFNRTAEWLDCYFGGNNPDFIPPFRMATEGFRRDVWEILLTIPYGKTMTYGEIAAAVAKKRGVAQISPQAVGGAVGHNPLLLVVPCHRVIGYHGDLKGYAAGIRTKIALLELEKADIKGLFAPKRESAP